jgi:hypothetical protein
MPVSGVALTAVHFFATDADGGKVDDEAQFTLKLIKDGVLDGVDGSITEVDATNAPGMYWVPLTAVENTGSMITLCGVSSSSGVTINPVSWTNISNVAAISGSVSAADNLESAASSDTLTANVKQVNGSTDGATFLALGAATMIEVTCDSGSTTSVIVGSGSISSVDDFYSERTMLFTTGDNANSARAIADYVGSTKKFTVSPAFTASAASSDKFIIV